MEIRLLGPVELWSAGREIPLGRPRQRCVLAALAITPRHPVGVDHLLSRVWDERLPGDARNVLYTHISRLRRVLEQAQSRALLRRAGGGYVLDIDPDRVDLHRARRLSAEARAICGQGEENDRLAAELLDTASHLWRGVPLAGLTGSWVDRTREGIGQERLALLTDGFAARLRLLQHTAVVAPLSELLADHPLSESLAGLLMLALYRSGRQADALQVYARLRRQLVDEIGDEPGAQLRQLHEEILRRQPALDPPVSRSGGRVPNAVPPRESSQPLPPAQLPHDVAAFAGRAAELAQLNSLLPDDDQTNTVVISAIDGTAGVGKTALAVHWAHRVRDRFPDGQLYVDLRGYAPCPPLSPLDALTRFLHALGVSTETVPTQVDEAAALYRSLLADRRVLVVLDNAASPDQVRPLLPGGGGCMVLTTSRHQLIGLVARDNAYRLGLRVVPASEAQELLTHSVGADRVREEPTVVAELAELCGYLPLALRIAAANVAAHPQRRIAEYVAQLRDRDRLAALAVPGDTQSAVSAAFDLSYAHLPDSIKQMFRLFGLLPGLDITTEGAAALAGAEPEDARRRLETLATAHLVHEHVPGRYTCHDLLRRYVGDRARQEDAEHERHDALVRLYGHYLDLSDAAIRVLQPEIVRLPSTPSAPPRFDRTFTDASDALAWLDGERANLVATVSHTARNGPRQVAWLLADTLRGYFDSRRCMQDWLTTARASLASATADNDRHAQAATELSLGGLRLRQGKYRDAVDHLNRALRLAKAVGWPACEAAAHASLGAVHLESGRLKESVDHLERCRSLAGPLGLRRGEATALGNLAVALRDTGHLSAANAHASKAMVINREIGFRLGEADNHLVFGDVSHKMGQLERAVNHFSEAATLFRKAGSRGFEGLALCGLAAVYRDRGSSTEALDLAETGLSLAHDSGHPGVVADARATRTSVRDRIDDGHGVIDDYREVVAVARGTGNRYLEADALTGMAAAQLRRSEHEDAISCVEQATTVAQSSGFQLLEARATTLLGEISLAVGDIQESLNLGERSLGTHRETGHRLGEASARLLLGRAHRADGAAAAGQAHLRAAYALFIEIGINEAEEAAVLLAP